jgi:acetyl esterase/lipase
MKPFILFAIGALVFPATLLTAAAGPERIELWPEGVPGLKPDAAPEKTENERVSGVHTPSMTVFRAPAETANGTVVIICPGGGYMRLSIVKEGTTIAEWLNSLGVTACVLRYRMVEYGHPAPLQDVLRAVRFVRSRADEFGARTDRIGVLGFSAGGHLTASAGTMFDDPDGKTGAALDAVSARPDFIVPVYPVITLSDPFAHKGSRRALLGENPTSEMIARMSPEKRVTKESSPAFIIHTLEDKTVPVENSILFFTALREAGVPAEMHIYESGAHGIGTVADVPAAKEWPKACAVWMRAHGWLDAPRAE